MSESVLQEEKPACVDSEQWPSLEASFAERRRPRARQGHNNVVAEASKSVGTARDSVDVSLPGQKRGDSPPSRTAPGRTNKIPVFCTFHTRGRCKHGEACRFTHAWEEIDDVASRGACYKTKLCTFNEIGRCCNGDRCSFAHGADELQAWAPPARLTRLPTEEFDHIASRDVPNKTKPIARPEREDKWAQKLSWVANSTTLEETLEADSDEGEGAQADAENDWSFMPKWFSDNRPGTVGDIDSCSTASEVMKTDVQHRAGDSSEDDESTMSSTSPDCATPAASCSREADQGSHSTNPEQLAEPEPQQADREEEYDLASVKVHQWDAEKGKWVMLVLDLTEELPPKLCLEDTCQDDTCSERPAITSIPSTRLAQAAKLPTLPPSRTPLRVSARLFVPQYFLHGVVTPPVRTDKKQTR